MRMYDIFLTLRLYEILCLKSRIERRDFALRMARLLGFALLLLGLYGIGVSPALICILAFCVFMISQYLMICRFNDIGLRWKDYLTFIFTTLFFIIAAYISYMMALTFYVAVAIWFFAGSTFTFVFQLFRPSK